MWAVLYHLKLVIFIHFKLNCVHFSSAKQTIKGGLFSLFLLKFSPANLKACNCMVSDVNWLTLIDFWDFSSFIKWVSKQPCSFSISLSWTIITECSHFLEQRVAIMQFTIVLLKNLVLFPLEQPHFIIGFVWAYAPFYPFLASTFALGELCVSGLFS